MLHSTTELYRVYNDGNKYVYTTYEYIQHHNIPIEKDMHQWEIKAYNKRFAIKVPRPNSFMVPVGRTMTIRTINGTKQIYFLGYSWYDTEEERNEEEAFRNAEALLNRERKNLLAKFENMTLDELRQAVAQLGI
jgi:hypothetical protein